MRKIGGEYRDQYFDDYKEYLRIKFDTKRKEEEKKLYSDSTINTFATDTFYLERREDKNFISWFKNEDSINKARQKLFIYLKGRKRLEQDVQYYLECMLMFRDFYYER